MIRFAERSSKGSVEDLKEELRKKLEPGKVARDPKLCGLSFFLWIWDGFIQEIHPILMAIQLAGVGYPLVN